MLESDLAFYFPAQERTFLLTLLQIQDKHRQMD